VHSVREYGRYSNRNYFRNSDGSRNFTPAVVVAQGETPEVALATLYFNEKTNTWEAEENYATYQNGVFVGNVHHFSKFKFGFEEADSKATAEAALDSMKFDKACYTEGETAKVKMEINWKGGIKCEGGASVEEIIKKAHSTLTTTTIKMVSAAWKKLSKTIMPMLLRELHLQTKSSHMNLKYQLILS